MPQLTARRPATAVLFTITAVFAVCAVEFVFHLSVGLRNFLNDWVYDNVVFAAGAACIARGVAVRRDRLAWILMGLAVTSWAAGDTVWTMTIGNDPSPPAPSFADLGYLGVYPLAYVSLILLLRPRMGSLRVGLWADGVIGAFAVGALGTAVLFPVITDALGGSPEAVATNLAYPLADLMLIALVVWGLALTGWRPGRTWGCLAAGLLVFAVSDCLYLYHAAAGTYVEGSATDLGWAAGALPLAWAGWQPERALGNAKPEGWPLPLPPVAFGLIALVIQVWDHLERVSDVALVLSAAALLAIIVRMAMTFAENMSMIRAYRPREQARALR